VKNLKTFESFDMRRDNCDRCGESTNNMTTMSMFNEDIICMDCKKKEKEDPEYEAAAKAEREQIKSSNNNYKGAIPNYKPLK